MRKPLLIFIMVMMMGSLYGQLIEECPDPNMIVLSSFCDEACVVCDIDGYTGTNTLPGLGEAPPGFCAGTLHNTQWVGFVAGSEDITLMIDVFDCEFDQNGDGIFEGLQIGIYQTTDCNSFSLVSNCDDQVFDNTTGIFSNTSPLTIGGIYFLVVDGAFGDVCSFTVNVTEGSTTAPDVEQVVPNIVSELEICPGGILDVTVDPPVFGAGAYYWTLEGEEAGTDLSTGIQFPSDLGFYELCVDPYNPCSDGIQACITIEVVPPEQEFFTAVICEGDVYNFGGTEYSDADFYDVFIDVANGCDEFYGLTLEVVPPVETFLEEEICVDGIFEVGDESFNDDGSYTVILMSESTGCDSVVYLDLTIIGTEGITQLYETICEGEEYLIGGDALTESGNHFYEFTDEVGCDSLVDLVLNVLPAPQAFVDATICNGQSYSFNNVNYTSTGSYSTTIPLPSGCDSIATLNLTVVNSVGVSLNEQICLGESYTVGMNTYTTTGTFQTTLPAVNGCDSIVTLMLEVIDPILLTDPVNICAGDSYTVDGTAYTTAGTYDFPYVLPNGCDSTYRLVLSVISPLTQTLNTSICTGQEFTLGGETFSSTGSYTVTTPAPNGCDSIYTLNLTVTDIITSTQNIELCNGESYVIDNTTLTTSGMYEFPFLSEQGCDSVVTINLQIADPIVTNLTESICSGLSYAVGNENFTTSGDYTVVLMSSEACDSTVNLSLTVDPIPVSVTTSEICAGSSINFNGTAYNSAGTYTANLSTPEGCDSTAQLVLTIADAPMGTTVAEICEDDTYMFNGVNYSNSGTYTDLLSTAEGCDSIDQLTLTVISNVSHTITPSICTGSSYVVNGMVLTEADSYTFILPSSAGCDSILTVILSVEDAIIVPLEVTICEGENYPVGDNVYTMTGNYEDAFITPEGCDSIVMLDLNVIAPLTSSLSERICIGETYEVGPESFASSGLYTVTMPALSTGCDSIVTLNLTVIDIPITAVNASICDGGAYSIDGANYTAEGIYNVPLLSADGCDSTIVLDLTVTDFYETNLDITRCEGEVYMVGDSTYSTTGSYQNNFLSQDGCDSVVNLTLLVNPLLMTSLTEEICEGESFTIAGISYSATGIYQETIPSILTGCDSTIVLDLLVIPETNTSLMEEICEGESFTVGNSTYTASGTYVDTLMTTTACDSIVELELNVLPILETFLVEEICEEEVYSVGANDYTTTGDYTTVFVSLVTGCDSIVYLDLTVNSLLDSTITTSICEGELYTIAGVAYSTSGTHQETVPSVLTGCDSTITLNLTVNPVYEIPLSGIICEGESYAVGDSLYTETGMWPTLLTTINGCDSLVNLDLTVLPVLTTSLDEIICAGDTYTVGNSVYSMTGSYTDILMSSSGCDSIVNLELFVRDSIETILVEEICADESYEVGTESFALSGFYTVVLTSVASGCDSIVYLDLTVNSLLDSTITTSICEGELYTIAGVAYSTSGTHQETIPSALTGCDSTIILNLTVNPVYETPLSGLICEGESYAVGDSLYTETGMWSTLLTTINGCDSLVNLDLTVLPVLTINLDEIICAGDTYTVGNTVYSMTGSYTETLLSSSGCDSIVNLELVVRDPIETMLEEEICADESYEVGTESFALSGSYTVMLTSIASGCDSIVYLDLIVNELAMTSLNEQICTGESFEMGGVMYTETGVYQADLSTTEGCDSTVVLDLYVAPCNLDFSSEVIDNGCYGDNAGSIVFSILVGTPPYTYSWQGSGSGLNGTGTIGGTGEEVTLNNLPADNYDINLLDSNGVNAVLSLSVDEASPLELSLDVLNYGGGFQLSCADASDGSILAMATGGTPPYNYAWSNGMSDSDVGDLPEGEYELVVTDTNGCSVSESSTLTAPALVFAELEVTSPVCADDLYGSLSLAAVAGGNGPYLYALDGGAYSLQTSFSELSIGMHTVSVQDANGCSWDVDAEILPAPELTVDLGLDLELFYGDSLRLLASTSYPVDEYVWSGGPIRSCDTCANPLIAPEESVSYLVSVRDENGCTAEDMVVVYVRKNRDVFIPTAFSPDGDALNDEFMIYGGGQALKVESFLIFNRWGESVFEGYDFLPGEEGRGWDGRHRGQVLSAGVYVYVAEISFLDGTSEVFKGEVMLMR